MTPSPITSWQIDGEKIETIKHFILLGFSITVDSDCSHVNKTLASWKKSYDKPNSILKKKKERERERQHFANKGLYSQNYGFSTSHV